MEWQPISTAPRDGEVLLIWNGVQRHSARWDRVESAWVSTVKSTTKRIAISPPPISWAILPSPPKGE